MISVIIPLYNKRQTILRAVNSVLKQTYKDLELIVVDDGSTDDSVDVLKKNINDERVRIIKQKNGGVSKARNVGAEVANGEWIIFLDADDYWLPDFLLQMYKVVSFGNNTSIVFCASYVFDETTGAIFTDLMIDKYYHKIVPYNFFRSLETAPHIGASLIYRQDFIQSGGFKENLKNNEDILLLGSIAMTKECLYVGKMMHVYSIGVLGQATRNVATQEKFAKDSLTVICEFYRQYKEKPINNDVMYSLSYRFKDLLLKFIENKNYALVDYYLEMVDRDFLKGMFPIHWIKIPNLRYLALLYLKVFKITRLIKGIQGRSHKSKYDDALKNSFKNFYFEQIKNKSTCMVIDNSK